MAPKAWLTRFLSTWKDFQLGPKDLQMKPPWRSFWMRASMLISRSMTQEFIHQSWGRKACRKRCRNIQRNSQRFFVVSSCDACRNGRPRAEWDLTRTSIKQTIQARLKWLACCLGVAAGELAHPLFHQFTPGEGDFDRFCTHHHTSSIMPCSSAGGLFNMINFTQSSQIHWSHNVNH